MNFPPVVVIRLLIALAAILITAWSEWHVTTTGSTFANEWMRDHFIRVRASSEPETRITVVDIDESSLASVGPWPWPRTRLADLIENLIGPPYSARGIALDLVLPEPAEEEGDVRLAMLAQHGPVVLAQAFDYVQRAVPVRVGEVGGGQEANGSAHAIAATGFIGNHAALANGRHYGNIGFVPDEDGTIRRLPTITQFENRLHPTLSLALFNCCADAAKAAKPQAGGFKRVAFDRAWDAYDVVPASAVLNQTAPAGVLSGRLILIGSSSLGLTDRVSTPLMASTPGVLVHAAALSTLLDEQAGKAPSTWPGQWIAMLFTILVAVVAAYTFPRLSAVSNVALLVLASLLWLALAYWIHPHDPLFSSTGPLISNLFLLTVAVPFDWQLAQQKSRQLLGTLRQYVAEGVVNELLRRNLKDPLTPQRLNVTTLIADMEGYTGQVESLTMEEAALLTRDFLECLTKPVLDKHGTLDKFTGDGLVAFWGAPLPIEDHADLALDAAQEIVKAVQRFSEAREQEGKRRLRVRIGIESGVAMAGDFGTSSRSIYTAVGDSVNVASRLEQLAREFPHDIIIGQGTVNYAKRHNFKLLGERLLRGKGNPTTIYTLESAA